MTLAEKQLLLAQSNTNSLELFRLNLMYLLYHKYLKLECIKKQIRPNHPKKIRTYFISLGENIKGIKKGFQYFTGLLQSKNKKRMKLQSYLQGLNTEVGLIENYKNEEVYPLLVQKEYLKANKRKKTINWEALTQKGRELHTNLSEKLKKITQNINLKKQYRWQEVHQELDDNILLLSPYRVEEIDFDIASTQNDTFDIAILQRMRNISTLLKKHIEMVLGSTAKKQYETFGERVLCTGFEILIEGVFHALAALFGG